MEDYQKCLILLSLIIMYLYYINNKKETFENLDTFIKKTNNGQWNFSTYNPYANLNEYNDSFILLYNDTSTSDIASMNYKEIMKYNKEKLDKFKNNEEINNQIKNLLNKYNKTDNKIANIEKDFRKMGLEYVYTVPLTSAYEKLNYIKNKTRLKTSINNFLIKDLRKYLINKYIEPESITNQIDVDNNITVSLKYTLLGSKTVNTDDTSANDLTTIQLLQKIKKYLKFDIINNGTTFGGSTTINIKFKIINYDNNENMVSIINDKVEILYKILFTEILNTNDEENILNRIDLLSPEADLKNISLYGYDTLKINQNDISPNCSVPSGDKTILNRYEIYEKPQLQLQNDVNLGQKKEFIIENIRTDAYDNANTVNSLDNSYIPLTNSGNYQFGYNCNIYDISYNLNGNNEYILDIYDKYNHFNNMKTYDQKTSYQYEYSNVNKIALQTQKYLDRADPSILSSVITPTNNVIYTLYDLKITKIDNTDPNKIIVLDNKINNNQIGIAEDLDNDKLDISGLTEDQEYYIFIYDLETSSFSKPYDYTIKKGTKKLGTLEPDINSLIGNVSIKKYKNSILELDQVALNNLKQKTKNLLITLINNVGEYTSSDYLHRPDTKKVDDSYLEQNYDNIMTNKKNNPHLDDSLINITNPPDEKYKLFVFDEYDYIYKSTHEIAIIHRPSKKQLNDLFTAYPNGADNPYSWPDSFNLNQDGIDIIDKDSNFYFIQTNTEFFSTANDVEVIGLEDFNTKQEYRLDIKLNNTTLEWQKVTNNLKYRLCFGYKKYNSSTNKIEYEFIKLTPHFQKPLSGGSSAYTSKYTTSSFGILNSGSNDIATPYNLRQTNFDLNFEIKDTSPQSNCISPKVDTTSNQIKKELENLRSIQGLDKRAKNNVKAILFANLNLNSFKNFVNANLKERNNLIRLRIQGKAYKFLDEIKKIESINSSILEKLQNEQEVDIDITEDKLIGAVHFIMEKHIRENNEEFYLKEKVLFNDQTLRTRNELIKEYIKETPSSELEKLFFMTTREKVDYFDNNTDNNSNLQNSAELELKLIEKMKTNELENYFKEVNTMTKDVNDRLKVIISTNSNNILRLHKKLNNLAGGLKKFTGGAALKTLQNLMTDDNCGIGTIYPVISDNGLLLHNYKNMSLEKVTSNLNSISYYKNKIYIVGNSGYFAIYNLEDSTHITGILYKNTQMVKIYEDLKHIHINNNQCAIVGSNGTLITNENLDTGKFILKSTSALTTDKNFTECLIHNSKLYIISKKNIYQGTFPNINNDTITSDSNLSNFSNLFINKKDSSSSVYCFGIEAQQKNILKIPTSAISTTDKYPYLTHCMSFNADIFIQYNSHTNIIYNDNKNSDTIHFDTINNNWQTFDTNSINNIVRMNSYNINANERLSSVFINNINIGGVSDKLVYYSFNSNSHSTYYNINIKSNSNSNIAKSKLYCLPNCNNSYSNVFHYGSAGQILNYNVNSINQEHLTIAGNQPILSGYDQDNNAVFTFNTNTKYKTFNLEYSNTSTRIRLTGNQNSYVYDNNKRVIRYNDYTPSKNNYKVDIFNIVNEKYVNISGELATDFNKTFDLVSDEINIRVNKFKETNKNEFVSFALFIDKAFKIWLKPDVSSNPDMNSYTQKLDFTNNAYNTIKLYINGREQTSYILNKPKKNSVEIAAIIYNDSNVYNNNSINLTDVSGDNLTLTVIPSSESASVIYNSDYIKNKEITNIDKNAKSISIGIKNDKEFKMHKIRIISSNLVYTNLRDYEINYLLEIDVNKAYKYLTKVKKSELSARYLVQKYRNGEENDIQVYLALIRNKIDRNNLQNMFINALTNDERSSYIKRYLKNNEEYIIPENIESDKIVDEKSSEQEKLLESLKVKLDKMKIEKEILSNQYKIEQRNRMFEQLDADKLVKKEDITKLDSEIADIDKIIEEANTEQGKSKSFFDKLLGFFSSEEKKDISLVEKITEQDKQKILESKKELQQQLEEIDKLNEDKINEKEKENEEKLKKLEEDYKVNLKKLKLENRVKLERERNNLNKKIENDEINGINRKINDDLEIKKDIIQNEKINLEMDKLFNIQKNLIKKQKSLLKIIKPKTEVLSEISQQSTIENQNKNKNKIDNLFKKIDKEYKPLVKNKINNNLEKKNENNIEETNQNNEVDVEETKNIINDLTDTKKETIKKTDIKTDILKEIDLEIKKEKKNKKKKPCVSFIDCYFKNLDDSFYTSYKKENTFIKEASLPKTKKPTCKPKKDCDVCYLETNGVPNSIKYSNDNNNNGLNLAVTGNTNAHFLNDYKDLPDCPFDTCMSCENINNYSLFNDKTFNDKLIKKFSKNQ